MQIFKDTHVSHLVFVGLEKERQKWPLTTKGTGGSLKIPTDQIHPDNLLEVVPKDLDIINVPKG
jgi:hypothetical protein